MAQPRPHLPEVQEPQGLVLLAWDEELNTQASMWTVWCAPIQCHRDKTCYGTAGDGEVQLRPTVSSGEANGMQLSAQFTDQCQQPLEG